MANTPTEHVEPQAPDPAAKVEGVRFSVETGTFKFREETLAWLEVFAGPRSRSGALESCGQLEMLPDEAAVLRSRLERHEGLVSALKAAFVVLGSLGEHYDVYEQVSAALDATEPTP